VLKLIITYFLTSLALCSKGQSTDTFNFSGVVISDITSKGIPGGTIMITKTKGYLCDSSGNFTIYSLASGEHRLRFSAYGYLSADTTVFINNSDIANFKWVIKSPCNGVFNSKKALFDLEKGKAKLVVLGGIAPVIYDSDNDFKRKYKIGYNVFGCEASDLYECLRQYNEILIKQLDERFGKEWRKYVRNDVLGL
jgi:hypothetical protein